jgi:SAM-dependent methyltransferase
LALASPARRLRFSLVERVLAREVGSEPVSILDAGCGDGLLALSLAERHPRWAVLGVDLRPELLSAARARARAREVPNVRFERADLTRAVPEDGFDVVLAIECLEEIEDDQAALQVMAQALAPGGMMIVHVPEASWRAVLPRSPSIWRDQVRQGYSPPGITFLLARAGLEVVSVESTFRGTVVVAQEIADRVKRKRLALRAVVFPLMAAAVRCERWGLTWGRGHALLAVARRPSTSSTSDHGAPGPGNSATRVHRA